MVDWNKVSLPGIAWVKPHTGLREILVTMTKHPLGAACVVYLEANLLGIITDGGYQTCITVY